MIGDVTNELMSRDGSGDSLSLQTEIVADSPTSTRTTAPVPLCGVRLARPNHPSHEVQTHRQVNDDAIDLTIGDVLELLTRTSDAVGIADGEEGSPAQTNWS